MPYVLRPPQEPKSTSFFVRQQAAEAALRAC